jgi:hypothetical protein
VPFTATSTYAGAYSKIPVVDQHIDGQPSRRSRSQGPLSGRKRFESPESFSMVHDQQLRHRSYTPPGVSPIRIYGTRDHFSPVDDSGVGEAAQDDREQISPQRLLFTATSTYNSEFQPKVFNESTTVTNKRLKKRSAMGSEMNKVPRFSRKQFASHQPGHSAIGGRRSPTISPSRIYGKRSHSADTLDDQIQDEDEDIVPWVPFTAVSTYDQDYTPKTLLQPSKIQQPPANKRNIGERYSRKMIHGPTKPLRSSSGGVFPPRAPQRYYGHDLVNRGDHTATSASTTTTIPATMGPIHILANNEMLFMEMRSQMKIIEKEDTNRDRIYDKQEREFDRLCEKEEATRPKSWRRHLSSSMLQSRSSRPPLTEQQHQQSFSSDTQILKKNEQQSVAMMAMPRPLLATSATTATTGTAAAVQQKFSAAIFKVIVNEDNSNPPTVATLMDNIPANPLCRGLQKRSHKEIADNVPTEPPPPGAIELLDGRIACPQCGRGFAPNRVGKHAAVCKEVRRDSHESPQRHRQPADSFTYHRNASCSRNNEEYYYPTTQLHTLAEFAPSYDHQYESYADIIANGRVRSYPSQRGNSFEWRRLGGQQHDVDGMASNKNWLRYDGITAVRA